MPVLNDFGPEAYERVRAKAEEIARRLNVQKEVVYGFFNETAHFPTSIAELEAWGNKQTKYGSSRRDPATGAWHPVMPGVNPDPRLSPLDRGGFNHVINNPEDAEIQRFQQVDPSGNVFGGSFDPAVNAAHPEWAGKMGGDTALILGQGGPTGGGASGPAGTYTTKNGPRTVGQMKSELLMNGYGGPYDDAAVVAEYQHTTGGPVTPSGAGGASGGAGGLNDLINAGLYGNEQEFGLKKNADTRAQAAQDFAQQSARDSRYDTLRQAELGRYDQNRQFDLSRYDANTARAENRYDARRTTEEGRYDSRLGQQLALNQGEEGRLDSRLGQQLQNQQFQQGRFDAQRTNDRSLYSSLAQALLGSAVELGSRPRDWVKYDQMLSGGKDITQQLFGDQPRADFSGFTGGAPEAGRVTDVLAALGLPQAPGGGAGAEQDFLARQGVTPMGDAAFFGPQAEARDQAFLGANGHRRTPLFGPGADAAEADWMGGRVGDEPYAGPEPYTPPPDLPMMPSVSDYREAGVSAVPRLKAAYQDALKQYGVDYLSGDDPRLLRIYQATTGLDEPSSRVVADKAAEYYHATGQPMPDSILAGYINDAHSQAFGTDPARGRARAVAQGYDDASRRAGSVLGATDPRTLQQYRDVGGLDPSSALDASRRMSQYAGATGRRPTTDELMRTIEEARTRGADPNQPYQQVRGLNQGYEEALHRRGVDHLGGDDPELQDLYRQNTGLTQPQARRAAYDAGDYYRANGVPIPDPQQARNVARARRQPAFA